MKQSEKYGFPIYEDEDNVELDKYTEELPIVYKNFYNALENTDVFFLMNEEKNGIPK